MKQGCFACRDQSHPTVGAALLIIALGVAGLTGCGGGGGGGGNPSRQQTPVKVSLNWATRTRALSGPASALSAVLTLKNASPNGGDFVFAPAINRNASHQGAYTVSLTSSNKAFTGAWPLHVEFHALPDGTGDVVGIADATVTIATDGSGIGDVATAGQVGSVSVTSGQRVLVGETKDIAFSVSDVSNPPKLLAVTPGSATFTINSGQSLVDVEADGTVTGFDAGTASVTATVDGKTSPPTDLTVAFPGGGLIRSVSVAGNDGNPATVTSLEGSLPTGGTLPAPDLSGTVGTIVRGGSVILSVVTPQAVDAILVGIDGQADYYRLDVSGTRAAHPPATPTRKVQRSRSGAPCPDEACGSAEALAQKYPMRPVNQGGAVTRGVTRASGVEYQVVLSVPSSVAVTGFNVNVQTVTGSNSSQTANRALAVNQTAHSSNSLQFTLTWSAPVDMDLHVKTPAGVEIGYNLHSDATGGVLDLDSNAGCSLDNVDNENITWSGAAVTGKYIIRPNLWSACNVASPIPYVITVNSNGEVKTYQGTFDPSEANHNSGTDPAKIIEFQYLDPNQQDLATVIMSEASIGNTAERTAVGSTLLNRMRRNSKTSVRDVWNAYAHGQTPTQPIIDLAGQLLNGTVTDNTGGATHFYSPQYMPREGDEDLPYATLNDTSTRLTLTQRTPEGVPARTYDIAGGLEQVEGLTKRNYMPSWASDYTAATVAGSRPAYYKFFIAPGSGPVRSE